MNCKHKVSAVIITYNCADTLEQTLKALDWCDEIVVVDSGSTDNTTEICARYSCKLTYHPFQGYGSQKQFATSLAENEWILSVDSDEVLSEELQNELKAVFSQEQIVYAGFNVRISFVFMGKTFMHGRESNGKCLRVFNRKFGGFNSAMVHEKVHLQGKIHTLKNKVYHHSHRDISHYLKKLDCYTTYSAKGASDRKKSIGKFGILIKLPATFFIKYFLQLNILNGFPGLVWSINSSYYSFIKHLKIYEKFNNKELRVLMYHKVSPKEESKLSVSVTQLEKQFRYIVENKYTCVRLSDIANPDFCYPQKPVLLTFDDGYHNNLELMYPLLLKYNLKAAIMLPVKYIGRTSEWDRESPMPLMDVDQLKQMDTKHIEFGLHSFQHRNYALLSEKETVYDICASFSYLKDNDIPFVPILSYPYGGYPRKEPEKGTFFRILEENGVKMGMRIGNKINNLPITNLYEIKRIDVRGTDSFLIFKTKLKKGRSRIF